MNDTQTILNELRNQGHITRWIVIYSFLLISSIVTIILITVLANRRDRKNWKIWQDGNSEYLEHMNVVAMAMAYPDSSINVTQDGTIKYTSDRVSEFTGWSRAELKGENLQLLFTHDELVKLQKFKLEHSSNRDKSSIESEIILKNGKIVPVDIMFSDFEHEGQLYTTLTIRDISHRKASEWAKGILEEKAAKASTLLALEETILRSGGWIWDMTLDNVEYSPGMAQIFGLKGELVSGNDLLQKVFIEDRAKVNEIMRKGIENCERYEMEYRVMQPNGRKDLVLCVGVPQCNENGKTVKVNGAVKLRKADVN